jgi:hypothetical protein
MKLIDLAEATRQKIAKVQFYLDRCEGTEKSEISGY